ncbi:histidinol dehydrogenase [Pigmentibacter ruber]|uniref:histidinol dehydrogenase n=1 Tax=Pigmentibacter ruber TaxID=2683196 RepID=UPI00131B78B7|nr:histidinol dehydrogenase [Pigmentibacter ruber]
MIISTQNWKRKPLDYSFKTSKDVEKMILDISQRGDLAINEYSLAFDNFLPKWIQLKPFKEYPLEKKLKEAILLAASRIRRFAEFQMESFSSSSFSDEHGQYSQIIAPIDRIAAYIPGGKAPLISSALMTLIPSQVAGCSERIAFSPSTNEVLLAAASLAGATQFLQIGGAQAICAAAFGYDLMPSCDLIVGPGNRYVSEAKFQLQNRIKIDSIAGPSEILIVIDQNTQIDLILEDILAQCEHGEDSCAVVVSCHKLILETLIQKIVATHSDPKNLIEKQIQFIYAEDPLRLISFCNHYAPEHLQWCAKSISCEGLKHYGALFIGEYSPVALGDYLSGPNHTLPTLGKAKYSSGLSVCDFIRFQTKQEINSSTTLFRSARMIAQAEGLEHHAKSLEMREKFRIQNKINLNKTFKKESNIVKITI